MFAVRRLQPSDWPLYRDLRLAALADAPDAFGSTLAREVAFPDALWRERLERADPDTSHPLVATLDGMPCALAWIVGGRDRAGVAELFQMWVAPEARGRGVGRHLLDACLERTSASGHHLVILACTRDNVPARRLYGSRGFVATGRTGPLREGSDIVVVTMERRDAEPVASPGLRGATSVADGERADLAATPRRRMSPPGEPGGESGR